MLLSILSHSMHASPLAVSGIALALTGTVLEGLSEWNSYCQGFDQSSNENKAASIFEWKYSEGWIANLIHLCI